MPGAARGCGRSGAAVARAARLAVAWLGLGADHRRSGEAPERVVDECRDVAEAIGAPARARRLLGGGGDALPGRVLRRPVLLLAGAGRWTDADLRAILAHELAHARGHDLAWNLVAHFASILLWFHPLAWRIRAAHAAACDAVCDAVAADLLGDVPIVRPDARPAGARRPRRRRRTGLAMARSSDVRRRVDALDRKVFRSPLPRRLAMPAVLGGGRAPAPDRRPRRHRRPASVDRQGSAKAPSARPPAAPTAGSKSRPSPPRPASRSRAPRSPGELRINNGDIKTTKSPPAATAGPSSNGPGGRPSTGSR